MPYDVNGLYSLPNGYRANSGQTIQPSQHNPPLEDLAAGLSLAFVRDGRAPATGNWNLNSNKITNLKDGENPSDAATVGQAAAQIGDYLDTVRSPGAKWLKRDGAIYNASDYPALAALLPALSSGIVWTSVTSPFGSATPNGIAIGGGKIIIVAGASAYVSSDGDTWSTVALPFTAAASNCIAYGGGRFVVVGSGGQTTVSTDGGATWSSPTTPLQSTVLGIKFGGGVFAVSHVATAGSSTAKVSVSSNGVSFTDRLGPQTSLYSVLVGDGAGLVVSDQSGYYYTSTDGATWATITPSSSSVFAISAVRNGSVAAVVGSGGAIQTTPDFSTMTSRASGSRFAILQATTCLIMVRPSC